MGASTRGLLWARWTGTAWLEVRTKRRELAWSADADPEAKRSRSSAGNGPFGPDRAERHKSSMSTERAQNGRASTEEAFMRRAVKSTLVLAAIGLGASITLRSLSSTRRLVRELGKRTHLAAYEEHSHEAVVHNHAHPHITHNRREGPDEFVGEWEHLTAVHAHEHNHAAVTHSHLPHENAEHEHLGEAHIHDHSHPTVS